jgi:hypothetical protein
MYSVYHQLRAYHALTIILKNGKLQHKRWQSYKTKTIGTNDNKSNNRKMQKNVELQSLQQYQK